MAMITSIDDNGNDKDNNNDGSGGDGDVVGGDDNDDDCQIEGSICIAENVVHIYHNICYIYSVRIARWWYCKTYSTYNCFFIT